MILIVAASLFVSTSGCGGYTNQSLYPTGVRSIYVEMFDNQSLRRGIEYELSDALAKRIEAETPYKIVSNRDRADTILSGRISHARESVLSVERESGRALEKEVELEAIVTWKNLQTAELLIDNAAIAAASSYTELQSQSFQYGSTLAANKLAERIVQTMEENW
jgi:hypothetical protein